MFFSWVDKEIIAQFLYKCKKNLTLFSFLFYVTFIEKSACIVVPFVLNFIRNKQRARYATYSNPVHYRYD